MSLMTGRIRVLMAKTGQKYIGRSLGDQTARLRCVALGDAISCIYKDVSVPIQEILYLSATKIEII